MTRNTEERDYELGVLEVHTCLYTQDHISDISHIHVWIWLTFLLLRKTGSLFCKIRDNCKFFLIHSGFKHVRYGIPMRLLSRKNIFLKT